MAQAPRIDVDLSLLQEQQEIPPSRAAELAGKVSRHVWFTRQVSVDGGARQPDDRWELTGSRPHLGRFATGRADVYYGNGNNGLVRPVIIADGFNYGPSDLRGLWNHFNGVNLPDRARLLDRLLSAGRDVILLGFDVRHTYIQANSGVLISCIQQAIARRLGNEPLVVGGVSMGGMIARHALAVMEREGQDHQTRTYLSYDTPHNGAWIPLILQQMAYFFEDVPPGQTSEPSQAELIRSAAAQQLLYAWVPDSRYSGEVATASPLRVEFVEELRGLGDFPAIPRKLGVANGSGDGTGRDLTPGDIVFDWKIPVLASATARVQPEYGDRQPIGGMHALLEIRRSTTTAVPPLDNAPGGALDSFGLVADALKAPIDEKNRFGCFVPTISAVAVDFDPLRWDLDPHTPVKDLPPDRSQLDDFAYDANTEHSQPTENLVDWIVDRLAS